MDRVSFRCSLTEPPTSLPHFWEHTVGSCHAPLALRADWQAQLRRSHQELGFQFVRFHGLLSDDMSTVVRYRDRLVYSFFNIDQIFDFLLSIGMKPFIELSFMPRALASGEATVFHYCANVTPPRDFRLWGDLIRNLTRHLVDRYGLDEVRTWFFEVWNEANWKDFWTGSQREYFELYRHSVQAVKEVDGRLKVGGPATAKNEWVEEFLDYCAKNQLPADFVSTHHYPNDPLWSEHQDTETQLAMGERGILRKMLCETQRRARGKPVYYTEWNISSNPRFPLQDEPYAAAFVVKTIMEAVGLVEAYSFWPFSDLFEEIYMPSEPFHGGFGLLNLHGIPKPTYRAFELLHSLGTQLLPIQGQHHTVDAWSVRKETGLTVLLTNHALPRQSIESQGAHLEIFSAPQPTAVYVQRIDADHANPKRHWHQMGEPEYLTAAKIERLQAVSHLTKESLSWQHSDGVIHVDLDIPAHAVAAVSVEF